MKFYHLVLFLMLNKVIPKSKLGFITCSNRFDGMGAQAHAIFSSILYAQVSGKKYVHSNLKKVDHNYDQDPKWEKKIEKYFSFKRNETCNLKQYPQKVKLLQVNLDDTFSMLKYIAIFIFTKSRGVVFRKEHYHEYSEIYPDEYKLIIKKLRSNFCIYNKEYRCYFQNHGLNIVYHIRRGDVNASIAKRFTSNKEIAENIGALIKVLTQNKLKYNIHFISLGVAEDFDDLANYGTLHLENDPFKAFYNMVKADVLFMSKSSFAYTAALLSEGLIFYEPFWHNPLSSWNIISQENIQSINVEQALKSIYNTNSERASNL